MSTTGADASSSFHYLRTKVFFSSPLSFSLWSACPLLAECCGSLVLLSLLSSSGLLLVLGSAVSSLHLLLLALWGVQGQIEEHIKKTVAFPSFAAFRPGVLLTDRPGESRWGEWFAQKIIPVFHPILPEKHCAVFTQTVAEAMMQHTEFVRAEQERRAAQGLPQPEGPKARIFENDEIRALKVGRE